MTDNTAPPQTAQQFTNEAPSAHSSVYNSLSAGAKSFIKVYIPDDDDQTVQVIFEIVKEEKPFLSQEKGELVVEDVTYIRKTIPGNDKLGVHRPIFDSDKRQFPYAWQQFQRGLEGKKGTPLTKIGLDAGLIRSLHGKNVSSVEDLAQVSDTWIASLGAGARIHRKAAQDFLASAKPVSSDIEALKEQLAKQNEMLEKAMELINKQAQENEELKSPRRGRPPKAA